MDIQIFLIDVEWGNIEIPHEFFLNKLVKLILKGYSSNMKQQKRQKIFGLTRRQCEFLKNYSLRYGTSESESLRRILDKIIDENKEIVT